MEIFGGILIVFGGVVALIGGIWFLVVAFQESILWGLGCLFVPFVSLIFLIAHWDRAGKPFLIQIAGLLPLTLGAALISPNS